MAFRYAASASAGASVISDSIPNTTSAAATLIGFSFDPCIAARKSSSVIPSNALSPVR